MTEEKSVREEIKESKETNEKILEELRRQNEKIEEVIKKAKEEKKENKNPKMSKSLLKKGYVRYIYIRENGEVEDIKLPIDESTTLYEKVPRLARPIDVLNWKGVPTIIQPAWSCEPFSKAKDFDEATQKNLLSAGWRLLANRQELGEIKPKKKMSGGMILIILAILGVLGYFLFT